MKQSATIVDSIPVFLLLYPVLCSINLIAIVNSHNQCNSDFTFYRHYSSVETLSNHHFCPYKSIYKLF